MSPCFKCEERTHGCHSTCERYQRFSEERRDISRQRHTERRVCEVLYETDKKIKKVMRNGKG